MKKGCFQHLVTWLDEVLPGRIRLYAVGSERLMVENYLCVSEMTREKIEIQSSGGSVLISGECLSISEMRKSVLIISGAVSSVAFSNRQTGA